MDFYRGGTSLQPRLREVRLDPVTGLLRTSHGISVFSRPDDLDRFGGAYRVVQLPAELRIIQRGADPFHFEIVPASLMTFADYEDALHRIVLTPA